MSAATGNVWTLLATDFKGCLGSLRSKIARGDFDGVGPFGDHFTGEANPGVHQGTVGEEEFLKALLEELTGETVSDEDLAEFCREFA